MMRMKARGGNVILFIILLTVFSLFVYGSALAASENTTGHVQENLHEGEDTGAHEGAHGEGRGVDRSADLRDLLYRFINFALLVIILIWALKKADIKSLFSKRIEEIRLKLETLKKNKESAEEKYRVIVKKLKDFEKERIEILEQYRKEGEAEKERIIAEANLMVQHFIEQSEVTIQQEIQAAKDRLKAEVANLAAQRAQEIMAREMKDEDQDRLVQEFIERVGKTH